MRHGRSNATITAMLLAAVFLWGGNNVAVKAVVSEWPPITTGCSRFLIGSGILILILRFTSWFGTPKQLDPATSKSLWWRCALPLASNLVTFNFAVKYTSASHVALYLGSAPIWALLMEERLEFSWRVAQKLVAALLALGGVFTLFWPALKSAHSGVWVGELLGLGAGISWAAYVIQCRQVTHGLRGVQLTSETMWRAAAMLLPVAVWEVWRQPLHFSKHIIVLQSFTILGGAVGAYVLWNTALEYWPASKVIVFNNLIPLSVMVWARVWLGEPVTSTFWVAMILILSGVMLSQTNWQKLADFAGIE